MLDLVIIGAGQAGLAAGRRAKAKGLEFEIVEAASQAGGSWPCYYDSLTLFSPARYSRLPDLEFPGDPERYPKRDEVVGYMRDYARHFDLPILVDFQVTRVEALARSSGYAVMAKDGRQREARAVLVASGGFGTPKTPRIDGEDAFQGQRLHSRDYRRPEPYAGQRVVVVGAGNSAVQIAVELAKVAKVSLATRGPVKLVPQRLLGKDIHFWLKWTGLDNVSLPGDPTAPVVDDGRYRRALRSGQPDQRRMFSRFTTSGVVWTDGVEEPVDAVIFATGFSPTLDFLQGTGALDARGWPIHRRGVSLPCPGLFFVGLPWQKDLSSATIRGAARDSKFIQQAVDQWLARRAAE
jgi:putative flavoprotein involved in K+ transport